MSTLIERITLEPMAGEHLPYVLEIEKAASSLPWHTNAFANELRNSAAYYLVARRNEEIVGYGGMWLIIDEAHITTLAVDPTHRGRRIGERLLFELLEVAIRRGMHRSMLEVRESNTVAQKLYEKYGFKSIAVRKHYYPDNRENALVMWTDDLQSPAYLSFFEQRRLALGLPPAR